MDTAPLGIYVHLPLCRAKCPYCDFNSRPARAGDVETYAAALEREMELRLPPGALADTIYFGGGTPTIFPAHLLRRLLQAVTRRIRLANDPEITIEANPESLSADLAAALRAIGFNRLSIGVQSFDDRVLRALGRPHDAARALAALRDARAVGWDNISLDLIFAVPGQTLQQWAATLRQALDFGPAHISAYGLTIEPGTEFHRRRAAGHLAPVGEEVECEMYAMACAMLGAAGFEHYEISNFALPGRRCRHNQKYWSGADYIGLGAGAHSRVAAMRWANEADLARYGAALSRGVLPVVYAERLSPRRRMDEDLILGLRTHDGACLRQLGLRHGRDAEGQYRTTIEHLARAGLALVRGSRVALTERGMALANEVALKLMA